MSRTRTNVCACLVRSSVNDSGPRTSGESRTTGKKRTYGFQKDPTEMKEQQKWEFFKNLGFIFVASRRSDSDRIQSLYIKKKGSKAHKGIKPHEIRQLLNVILRTFAELLFEFDKVQFAGNSSTTTVGRNSGAWMLNGCIHLLYKRGV